MEVPPLDLDKLIKAYHFEFDTDGLVTLLCKNFSAGRMGKVSNWLKKNGKESSENFARYFITQICEKVVDSDNEAVTEVQANCLTGNDLERFSEQFLKKNKHLLNDQRKNETIRKKIWMAQLMFQP
jgi:hypothetical protein